MNLVIASSRRPLTVIVLIVAAAFGAWFALQRMSRDILPPLGIPTIYVAQPYGGMDPAQMEGFLTDYYEYHFLYITGIEHVESKSIQGASIMKLQFHPGTDMSAALSETVAWRRPQQRGWPHNFDSSADYGIGLAWRAGTGGLFDRGRIRGSEARVEAGRLEREKLREDITRQIVDASTWARSLGDQITFAGRALDAGGESLKLAGQRQQFGVGEVLENIQAEQDLTRARLDNLGAVIEHNRAQFALERAVGGPDSEPAKTAPKARSRPK